MELGGTNKLDKELEKYVHTTYGDIEREEERATKCMRKTSIGRKKEYWEKETYYKEPLRVGNGWNTVLRVLFRRRELTEPH